MIKSLRYDYENSIDKEGMALEEVAFSYADSGMMKPLQKAAGAKFAYNVSHGSTSEEVFASKKVNGKEPKVCRRPKRGSGKPLINRPFLGNRRFDAT